MLRETSATGDIGELLVSTLLVVVALSLFLVSLGSTITLYAERADSEDMDARARNFCMAVRSSHILASDSPGSMDVEKMSNSGALLLEFPTNRMGFNYIIIVEDTSLYHPRMDTMVVGTAEMGAGARHSASMPVVLETGSWERRTGMLTVVIWGLQ